MTEREKNLAIIVGGVAGLAVVYWLVSALYFGPRTAIERQLSEAQAKLEKAPKLIEVGTKANQEWQRLHIETEFNDAQAGGNASAMTDSMLRQTVTNAAIGSNITISTWQNNGPRGQAKNDFREFKFTTSFNTNTARLARFLLILESTPMPARIDDMTIQSRKLGNDDLHVEIGFTALVYTPKKDTSAFKVASAATKAAAASTMTAFATTARSLQPLDPPLPQGADMETRLLMRRKLQLENAHIDAPDIEQFRSPATAPAATPMAPSAPARGGA